MTAPKSAGSRGRFIVFEGIGGSGKSTTLKAVAARLTAAGHDVLATRQPGGTPIGAKIRELVLNPEYKADIDPNAQLFLYAADRYIHVQRVIKPALAASKIVLCDRYDHSTRAYQSAGGGDPAKLDAINALSTGGLRADRTYWFDVDVETARRRTMESKRSELDRFDQETMAFWNRLRDSYAAQARQYPDEIKRIDGAHSLEQIVEEVATDLQAFLKN